MSCVELRLQKNGDRSPVVSIVVLSASWRAGLAAVAGGGRDGVEVHLGQFVGLFDGLWTDSKALFGGGDGALHHGHSGFGAGGCILGGTLTTIGQTVSARRRPGRNARLNSALVPEAISYR